MRGSVVSLGCQHKICLFNKAASQQKIFDVQLVRYPQGMRLITAEKELTEKEIFMQYVFPNKLLWYIAIAKVLIYLLRYGILDWSPTYLKQVKHFALDKSSWAYFLYEYAGIPGTLLYGWMSDKMFKGNRGATGVLFMTLVG